jgi:rubrerythrin
MDGAYTRIEAIDLARQIEACGEAWYDEAHRHAKDAGVRRLLQHLRDEEKAHSTTFEALLAGVDGADGSWRQDESYVTWMRGFASRRVFPDPEAARDVARGLGDDRALLERAIAFERQTVEFLEELRTRVRPEEADVIDHLVAEEREHEHRLIQRLSRFDAMHPR